MFQKDTDFLTEEPQISKPPLHSHRSCCTQNFEDETEEPQRVSDEDEVVEEREKITASSLTTEQSQIDIGS